MIDIHICVPYKFWKIVEHLSRNKYVMVLKQIKNGSFANDLPFGLIIFMIGTVSYQMAKYLAMHPSLH